MADTMSYIRPFIEAVYPEAPDLALASFSERQCLIDATERIRELDREAATLRRHLGFAVKLFDGLPFLRGTAQVEAMRAALKSPPTQGGKND